jgi:hypothetical protein
MAGVDVERGRPTARRVYRSSFALFRAHWGVIVGLATVVLVPFAVVDALGLLRVELHHSPSASDWLAIVLTLVVGGISGLASIFYAGMLDHASAAWHRGETAPTPSEIAGRLPWLRLVGASFLWLVAVVGGMLLFVVPGVVALVLFSLAGPVLVREDLGAFAAMRRSATLARRRPVLVLLTAVLPFVLESSLAEIVAAVFGHSVPLEVTVEVLASLLLASFVGLLEVVTTHQLIAAEQHGDGGSG